jgi:hypothetical protein
MWSRLARWLWGLLPDKCEQCGGAKGGMRGNENVINGRVLCDYCMPLTISDYVQVKTMTLQQAKAIYE